MLPDLQSEIRDDMCVDSGKKVAPCGIDDLCTLSVQVPTQSIQHREANGTLSSAELCLLRTQRLEKIGMGLSYSPLASWPLVDSLGQYTL